MSSADALRCGHCGGENLTVRMAAAPRELLVAPPPPPLSLGFVYGPQQPLLHQGAPVKLDVKPSGCAATPAAPQLHFALVACATCRAVLGALPLPPDRAEEPAR
jgi:hypothetical protein